MTALCRLFLPFSAAALILSTTAAQAQTVVVDASAFFDHMPKGTIMAQTGARGGGGGGQQAVPAGAWLFNNTALTMRSQAYLYAKADIPEAGVYNLFVRSHGDPASSFRVSIGDKQTSAIFGNEPLRLKPGGSFDLKQGNVDVVLSRVVLGGAVGSTFDALVLTKKTDFTEDDMKPLELPSEVVLLKEYTLPRSSAVKFGDVDGDGKTDIFVLTSNYAGHMLNHEGRELWSYQNPEQGARQRGGFEAPGLVWDFDRDGSAEAVHYQLAEGKEWLVVSDGKTGATKFRTEWPTLPMPHEYNNFRLAVAKLSGDYPRHILAFTDSGGTISITAYTSDLKQEWQHVENKKKDHLGHYVYAIDINKDGIDEVAVSGLMLDAKGKVLWSRFDLLDDNHDHCDSLRFHDIDGDGQLEILAPVSELGVMVFRGRTGELMWRHGAEHTQQLEAGNYLRTPPGPHVAVNARTYARNGEAGLGGQVHWFDAKGNLLSKWPANPLNGNPDFVKGDWKGDGKDELFWFKFRLNDGGKGELYFKQDVYHMFDFMGNGAEQVIARGGTSLLVYGYRGVKAKSVKRDFNYQKKVANHTHY
ncbi:MAG TPA: hypothetical protein VER03_14985 [Bryobacteraceae bacterium]|nr:hypothetical protein [Bryobacteraceae bacterium]